MASSAIPLFSYSTAAPRPKTSPPDFVPAGKIRLAPLSIYSVAPENGWAVPSLYE